MTPSVTLTDLVTFGLLTVALACLWLPGKWRLSPAAGGRSRLEPWMIAVALATVVALISGHLDWRGVVASIAMGVASWGLYRRGLPVGALVLFGFSVVALAAGLALHLIPGFNNPKVISDAVLTPDAVPYSKYLNFDKALIGLFLLAHGQQLIGTRRDWALMLRRALPVTAGTVGVVLVLSFVLGYVRFELAVPDYFWLWAWTNLFFTCMAEEAIFRGLIQRGMERGLERFRLGSVIALVVASLLFGLAHWAGGPKYVLLSTVAGFGYGLAMRRSGRIEGSILTHFLLNVLHYSFFTYPALASAVG